MTAPKLPAVRLTPEGECVIQEDVSLELHPNNKFSISYAPSASRRNSVIDSAQPHFYQESRLPSPGEDGPGVSSIAEEGGLGEEDRMPPLPPSRQASLSAGLPSPTSPTQSHSRMKSFPDAVVAPFITRTRSMPLPSQLSQLQHPHRPSPSGPSFSTLHVPSAESNQVREVSMELADSIQLVIQTMLQISPPQVLDPAKEQFSACALSVPTSSMSAMFTAMKNINYISANMSSFCEHFEEGPSTTLTPKAIAQERSTHMEFDIGEMLQCVGDTLSGAAAQTGVDLVLYHGDVGLKHVFVSGDESGISFALSHIVRQVLGTAERGDSIELGLLVNSAAGAPSGSSTDALDGTSPIDEGTSSNGPIRVKIRVSHKFAAAENGHGTNGTDRPKDVVTTEIRAQPSFSTLLLRRILKQIEGTLITDLPPPESFANGRTCDLELVLDRVDVPPESSAHEELQGDVAQEEPTIERLSAFGETLKGKKVTLYANAKGSFAQHLTSYLTAWGMDVNHVSPDGQGEGITEQLTSMQDEARQSAFNPLLGTYTGGDPSVAAQKQPEARPTLPGSPNFIFIDDDVDILKDRLQALRFELQPQFNTVRKRPSLSAHHRPRSSPQIARILGINNLTRPSPVVIMHFTSLANYKVAKDAMQSIMASYASTSTPLPEVMIIPKPAGPRRFLTALYTAVTKPVVDPWFTPIATSPMSPGVPHSQNSFFGSPISEHEGPIISSNESQGGPSQATSPVVKNGSRPSGTRSNSDRSTRSTETNANLSSVLPPSPLALPDNVEYFSAAAERLGASPSSGLVIQSPDGQTAGIYFHPRSKNPSKNASSQSMERDRGQLGLPSPRRGLTPRIPSGSKKDGGVSFSSLHEATAQTEKATSPQPPPGPSPTASFSAPSMSAISGLPGQADEESPVASSSTAIPAPISRKASEDGRKAATPAASPATETTGTPSFRRGKRERTESKDGQSSSAKKSKSATGSDNVVPPISVLIVDDNPINQTILSTFMRRKKIKYDLASNGQEAVQKWRTGGFHLILMDIQMPVMDGIQATKEIRRLEKANAAAGFPPLSPASTDDGPTLSEKSIPSAASSTTSESRSLNSPYRSSVIIVALTASSLQSDRVAALAAGCNDFLTKPVSLLWLNNKIIEWGSIKALQMWADIRQDGVKTIANGQAAQARNVAERLHVPVQRGRASPSTSSPRKPTSALEDNAAALALASPAGALANFASEPRSASTSTSRDASRSQSLDAATIREALDNHPLKRKSLEDGQYYLFDSPLLGRLAKRLRSRLADDSTPKPSISQTAAAAHLECTNATASGAPPERASSNDSDLTPGQNGQAGPGRPSAEHDAPNTYSSIRTSSPVQEAETIHVPSASP